MATVPPLAFTVTRDVPGVVRVTQVGRRTALGIEPDEHTSRLGYRAAGGEGRRPPNPLRCERCGKPRMYRPPGEACCNWLGRYRGRHRREH